jgi:PAS domain S-box-containing protein
MTASGGSSISNDARRAEEAAGGAGRLETQLPRARSPRLALLLAGLLVLLAVSVLAGWAFGIPTLTSWVTGVQTKINAAICLGFLGLGVAFRAAPRGRGSRAISWLCALIVVLIAGATLFEHLAGIDLGIDQALARDTSGAAAPYPGRFAIQTAVALLGGAFAILTLGRSAGAVRISEILAFVCGTVGAISLLGYLYGAPALLSIGSSAQVSLPASVALVVACVAILAVDPEHVLVRLWRDSGIAGQVIRRFLPAALLIVPAGAWLRLVGERAGLYDESVGLAIMVAFEAVILVGVGAWMTFRVQRLEIEHMQAVSDLMHLGAAASTPLIGRAPVGLAVLDGDLRYLYVNPALASIGRVSATASLGQRIDRVVPAFGGEAVGALTRVLETGLAIRDLEVTGEPRPGEPGTWLLSAEALVDAAGQRIGVTISVVDITERKRREEALAAAAELRLQAQAIGESIPFGIWLAHPDGRMRYLSPSFLEMTGRTMEQARDFGWMASLAPELAAQIRHDWAEAIEKTRPWNHELVVLDADDRRRTILSRGLPIRDESGQVTSWAGINLDITDRKDAEAFREAFLGILSHELGTPITSIYAASTLLMRPGLDEARTTDLVNDIGHESDRLRRLVQDLVVLARAERGTIQVHTEPVLLQHVLRKVCDQEQRRWPDRRFELTVAPALPVARADETLVEQIVGNLVENAAKYGPADGPIELIVDAPDGCPRVRVLDRGPGIDPAEADRLFDVFYRSERTARVAGSGIGLFVAHRLVESIGGTIWARPRDDGPGAEFGFQLQPFVDDAV